MDFSFITYKYFDGWNAQTVLFTIITVIIERVELMQQRKNEKKTLQRPSVHIFFLHSRHNQREKLEFHCWGKCSCNWYFAWWKQRSRQFEQSAPHTHFKLRGDLGAFGLTKEKIKQSSSRRKWYKKKASRKMGEQSNCQDVERHFSCIETLSKVWFEDKWDLERKMSSNRVRFSINFIFCRAHTSSSETNVRCKKCRSGQPTTKTKTESACTHTEMNNNTTLARTPESMITSCEVY